MREILFRSKRDDNGEWETGSLVRIRMGCSDEQTCIADKMTGYLTPIIPKTVGQYTGLTDKNGVRIFEGDIVRIYYPFDPPDDCVVYWLKESAKWNLPGCDGYFCTASKNCEIIGNIHDNPELLER